MRTRLWLIEAFASLFFVAPQAQAADLSGEVGVVSDYRYRGLSLSEADPALHASLNLDLGKGAYAGLWASSIKQENKLRSELDFNLGEEFELRPNVSLEISATYFAYPSRRHDNYAEATAILSAARGALTGKIGISVAPAQRAMRDEFGRKRANLYYFGSGELELAHLPAKVTTSFGYERGAFDEVGQGGKWDWSFGAEIRLDAAKFGIAYIDSNAGRPALVGSLGFVF
ncbi:TorF family putative porin [Sphingomonas flavescens]|uniref:TorF family putative porin n=1 Tax=Sphingomonas flavescens TaxID=3132797 RepID=UPI002805390C|nr:TorF family putative porin [Sphingomonas limnosediminicola]